MCNDKIQHMPTGVRGCCRPEDKFIGKRILNSILDRIAEGTFLCIEITKI
jgi:hypothetical protein